MPNYFLQMIQQLRQQEEVLLYANLLEITDFDSDEVLDFLAFEYDSEAKSYPFQPPIFDKKASIWAAKLVYRTAQLMLYRKDNPGDLPELLPKYAEQISASAILSADLTLRFLPNMLTHLHLIDFEDELIHILKEHLQSWHFSGIHFELDEGNLDFKTVLSNQCLNQLYIDRIISIKKKSLAQNTAFSMGVNASLGIFKNDFWQDLK